VTKKVLIYDDNSRFIEDIIERIRKVKEFTDIFSIESMNNDDFKKEINILVDRQKGLRKGEICEDKSLELDKASILIIEYDLVESVAFLTGEYVSYLARCFSKCDLIIGMNQFGSNMFDLTLKGHPESFSDINLGSKQIDNPGLWGDSKNTFRPWYWPLMPNYLESFKRKTEDIIDHLDEPIFQVLKIEELVNLLPRRVIAFIGKKPTTTTFRDFVEKSGNGLKPKDKNTDNELVARIAVARLSKWLERLILPGQNFLVDAPHLVYRYPSLLLGDIETIDSWNKTTAFGKIERLGIDQDKIEVAKYNKDFWLSRHVWFWQKLYNNQKIREVSSPWEREEINFRFCEDSSRFHTLEDCDEFIIESDSPYLRRYIFHNNLKGADYEPRTNLIRPL